MAAKRTKRRSYDDKFRASTVVLLEAAGYPNSVGALQRVADQVGAPAMTISRWFNATRNPPPNEVVNEKRLELSELLDIAIRAAIDSLPEKLPDAPYKDTVTAIGIMTDKKQLVDGKATERQDHTGTVEHAIRTIEVMRPAPVADDNAL